MRAEGISGSSQREASEVGFLIFPIVILDQCRAMSQCLSLTGFCNGDIYSGVTACHHQQSEMALQS